MSVTRPRGRRTSRGSGTDDYVTKPIDYDHFLATVKAHLDNAHRVMAPSESPGRSLRS